MQTDRTITYTIKSFEAATGLSRSRIYELLTDGTLPSVKFGGKTLIPADVAREIILGATKTAFGSKASPQLGHRGR